MTWVVAASTIFGYGALYSDVQVTFRDGTTRDLVQKGYPIANAIAGGFAGSVQIGFRLVERLRDRLIVPGLDPATYVWEPIAAAAKLAELAPPLFSSAPPEERRLGARVLLVAASPVENQGLGAKVYLFRFVAPDFRPQVMTKAVKLCSIGTGSGVAEYKRSIKPLLRRSSGLMQAEVGRPGGWGNHLGHSISQAVGRHPRDGIGRRMNIILVHRRGFMFGKTDQIFHNKDGTRTEYKMPEIAKSYKDFLAMASASGLEAACAEC
jgi:hypothetical protein